ncbi:dihydrouridine synthase [Microthyrium microscopicum]|uniref:tRNA-dihydrouridine(16/17) synthase [NAD(P)(+)] n=1 Tax=Microthyrium microscopicum TaxID=703497 RepID=A0A6A6U1L7_9PEZI|nr:dihydrouridine synthase [Microthyrium microscopicum]
MASDSPQTSPSRPKLHGRAFYESIGSPNFILAPMVDQSEFAWRLLTRFFLPAERQPSLLAYTPMFHARLFASGPKYRDAAFQPFQRSWTSLNGPAETAEPLYLDGNPAHDRPLFVQFCANDPTELLSAAQYVAPYCDAIDLNLGCPQGIARKGHYGAFLQEDWDLIYRLINTLHTNLSIPVTAKMRILDTREQTLAYACMILSAGASIITVHGRRREQKGHNTGVADWEMIKYLRDNLPADTVLFANGNILQHSDIQACLAATGADGVMSAEGNLHDPSIFAEPPTPGSNNREYWWGADGRGGYRVDAVLRRYLDIIYTHVLGTTPPVRQPLFIIGDKAFDNGKAKETSTSGEEEKKQSKASTQSNNPNLTAMKAHVFALMRSLIPTHTHIRDTIARARGGDMDAFEQVLALTEAAIRDEFINQSKIENSFTSLEINDSVENSSIRARCVRPWWVVQPYIRPLPEEAIAKGSMQMSKKAKKELAEREMAANPQAEPIAAAA